LAIELSPTTFRFPVVKRQTQELNVVNSGNFPVRYRVSLKKPGDQKNSDLYMGDWIRIHPKILSVPPKSTRVVRFRATPPKDIDLKNGEYRAILVLEQILTKEEDYRSPEAKVEEEINNNVDPNGPQLSIDTLVTFELSIYGEVGELQPNLKFEDLKFLQDKEKSENLWLKGKIHNIGNVSKKTIASIVFIDKNGKKSEEPLEVSFPISIRENTTEIETVFKKPIDNIKKAEIKIRYWSPLEVDGPIVEEKVIEL